jgi:hypothetical protein
MRLRHIAKPPDGFIVVDDNGNEVRRWFAAPAPNSQDVGAFVTSPLFRCTSTIFLIDQERLAPGGHHERPGKSSKQRPRGRAGSLRRIETNPNAAIYQRESGHVAREFIKGGLRSFCEIARRASLLASLDLEKILGNDPGIRPKSGLYPHFRFSLIKQLWNRRRAFD